jgi:hypothetical protein
MPPSPAGAAWWMLGEGLGGEGAGGPGGNVNGMTPDHLANESVCAPRTDLPGSRPSRSPVIPKPRRCRRERQPVRPEGGAVVYEGLQCLTSRFARVGIPPRRKRRGQGPRCRSVSVAQVGGSGDPPPRAHPQVFEALPVARLCSTRAPCSESARDSAIGPSFARPLALPDRADISLAVVPVQGQGELRVCQELLVLLVRTVE